MKKIVQITAAALFCLSVGTASAQVTLYGNVTNGYDTAIQTEVMGQTFTVNYEWQVNRVGIHQFDIASNGNVEQTMLVTNKTLLEAAGSSDDWGLGWYDAEGKYHSTYAHLIYGRCGAVYANGVYHTFNPSEGDDYGQADNNVFTQVLMRYWDAASYFNDANHSPLSWTQIGSQVSLSPEKYMSFTDLTYDYEDDQVYGISVIVSDESPAVPYLLTKVDLEKHTATPVSTLGLAEEMRALAAHPNGHLYGIGASGTLYQIDKETAECTALGVLHKSQHRIQSAVVDWRTGKMYWTCNEFAAVQSINGVPPTQEEEFNNNVTALYEVNVETATETKLYNYPLREEVSGLFFIDDFVKKDYDLNVKWASTPLQMIVGEPAQIVVTVKNVGNKQFNSFTAELYVNGQMVKSQNGGVIKAGNTKDITFTYTPEITTGEAADIYVKVVSDKDENPDNNETAVKTIVVQQADLPTVTINGTQVDDKVNISWSKPQTGEKTEDFERYAPFIIDNIGNWTLIDRDGAYLSTWNSALGSYTWPNNTTPQAYQVFNPWEAGFDADHIEDPMSTYYCQSGNQMLMAQIGGFGPSYEGGQNTYVDGDNWLISPELTGEAQTIYFYAKSWTSQIDNTTTYVPYSSEEQFNVWYSLTDTDPSSFILLESLVAPEYFEDPFEEELPEGTKYFAIQHVTPWVYDYWEDGTMTPSTNMTAFFLDDITYTPAVPGILGYNIYRNGTKLNQDPVSSLRYSVPLVNGHNDIYVTVVYENGESAPSNYFSVDYSGGEATAIHSILKDQSSMVNGVSVYTTAGQYVGNRLPEVKGTYVVRQNGKTQKVVVK